MQLLLKGILSNAVFKMFLLWLCLAL